MPLKIKQIEIKKLFEFKDILLNTNDITVLVGKNGLGKTTVLKIIHALLTDNKDAPELKLCESASITFNNEEKISYSDIKTSKNVDSAILIESFESLLENTIKYKKINQNEIDEAKEIRLSFQISDNDDITNISNMEISYTPNKDIKNQWKLFNTIKKINHLPEDLIDDLATTTEVCYISTLSLSANSLMDIDFGDGKEKNLLNLQLDLELNKLTHENRKYSSRFIQAASDLLSDSEKSLLLNDNIFNVLDHTSSKQISTDKLSSGEKQLLYVLAKIANTRGKNTFLLMDEPEISLHLNWQEQLLKYIKTINEKCQIIVVTHSPAIIMNGFMDALVDMKDISVGTKNG